jgi:hypothetical protein
VAIAGGADDDPPEIIPGPTDFRNFLNGVRYHDNEILLVEKVNS